MRNYSVLEHIAYLQNRPKQESFQVTLNNKNLQPHKE